MADEKKLSRQRRWQLKMEAIGLCRQCGHSYAKVGLKHCRECIRKIANRNAAYYRRKKIDRPVPVDA